jgi:hypothetical protein
VPPSVIFDYGLALYLEGNYDLAKQAFTRVLSISETQPAQLVASRVMRIMCAYKQGAMDEVATLVENAQEEETVTCSMEELGETDYWPNPIKDDLKALLEELCRTNEQSFFSR